MYQEKKAILFASSSAFVLASTKLIVGLMSWSIALISSAVDSLLDFWVSIVNLYAIKKSKKPANHQYNYGHGKIEWLAALFEGLIIIVSGISIVYSAIQKFIRHDIVTNVNSSIGIMIFAILVTWAVVYVLSRTAKKTQSLIVKADLMHYKTDFFTNAWVIITLILVKLTWLFWIDQIVSIAIAIYIIIWSLKIMREWFDLVMDKSLWKDKEIINIIHSHTEVESHHYLKTRKSGKISFVDVHLVFKDRKILLQEAHRISDLIEDEIKKLLWVSQIFIHLDPYDDRHKDTPQDNI